MSTLFLNAVCHIHYVSQFIYATVGITRLTSPKKKAKLSKKKIVNHSLEMPYKVKA
jgi:hypothetical protein